MARIRGAGAREYSRHTRDVHERGFQWSDLNRVRVQLGPFVGVSPGQELHNVFDRLHWLNHGILDNGVINQVWIESIHDPGSFTGAVYCADNFGGDYVGYNIDSYSFIIFQRTNTVRLLLLQDDSEYDSGQAGPSITGPRRVASWGDVIYVGCISDVRKFSFATGSWSAVASSPADMVSLTVVANNVIGMDADELTIRWAVDGLPEDWTSAGSGNQLIVGMGRFVDLLPVSDDIGYALFERGIVRISPTGVGSPAFRFDKVPNAPGAAGIRACAVNGMLLYASNNNEIVVYDGSIARTIASRQATKFGGMLDARYVNYLGKVVTVHEGARKLIIDPFALEVVGTIDYQDAVAYRIVTDFVIDTATANEIERAFLLMGNSNTYTKYVIQTAGPLSENLLTGATEPEFSTHVVNFEREAHVDRITMVRTSTSGPEPKLTVDLWHGAGASSQVIIDPDVTDANFIVDGYNVHYMLNRSCDSLKLTVNAASSGSAWAWDRGISHFVIYGVLEYDEQTPAS